MPKILDEDSDSDLELKTNNEYAKTYNKWRMKEESNKLKTKYGEELLLEESSSTSSEDEDDIEVPEEEEKQFLKILSYLKSKDPRIYDANVQFFNQDENDSDKKEKKKKKKKEVPMYIGDYERELILKKNGELSDSDGEGEARAESPTHVEEQKRLKENIKKVLNNVDEADDDDLGGMLKVRQKTKEENLKEEADFKEWLAGQREQIDDKELESELKPLKDFWNNPDLTEGEKFLKDYYLEKGYSSKEVKNEYPTYGEIILDSDKDLSEDEKALEEQEEFEHKYNFRFEEPDQDFLRRYPRTIEHSLRKTDDRRKIKRAERKDRKRNEKEQKLEELKKLQEAERREYEEKLEKLKEVTGDDDLGFTIEDLEADFDPEAHDKQMESRFNEKFYEVAEGDEKPKFPELDKELGIENWANYEVEDDAETEEIEDDKPYCEDDDFNMDCDYDPRASTQKELIENTRCKKKRKRKSLFAKAASQAKLPFDPKSESLLEYADRYYNIPCEDVIGDTPCKFKYREVPPNSYGLSIEEIWKAEDRELNRWCSLKKALQHKPDHVEKYDQIAYAKKATNVDLKKRILPSLFKEKKNDEVVEETKMKRKKVRCKRGGQGGGEDEESLEDRNDEEKIANEKMEVEGVRDKKKKKKKHAQSGSDGRVGSVESGEVEAKKENNVEMKEEKMPVVQNDEKMDIEGSAKDKKKKKKKKARNSVGNVESDKVEAKRENIEEMKEKMTVVQKDEKMQIEGVTEDAKDKKRKKKKKKKDQAQNGSVSNVESDKVGKKRKVADNSSEVPNKKARKEFRNNKKQDVGISDARLAAYGLNPKKFKNKLKYGKS